MSVSDLVEPGSSSETLRIPHAVQSLANTETSARSYIRRWLGRLTTFAMGQGLVQVLGLVTGFLLIRWLSVDAYAAYSMATGFQGTAGVLVEMGLGGSIVALLAGRTDPHLVGQYIRSVRHLRNWSFFIFLPILVAVFFILTSRQGWHWPLTTTLLAGILVGIYGQGLATFYSTSFIIHQDLRRYYNTPALLGVTRLVISFLLYILSFLTAAPVVWLGSATALAQGWFYKRHSSRYVIEPAQAEDGINREVVDYIRPLIPSTIFFAVQGQITILLISWFGKSQSIAEVGALGRIAQLFLMLAAFNTVVIAPTIAKLPRSLLPKRYLQTAAAALGLCIGLLSLSALFPGILLSILGSNYSHLEPELVLMMAGACVSYLGGVLWTMHCARKWTFTWVVWAYIATSVAVQAFGIAFLDLSTTRSVLQLSFITGCTAVAVQITCGIYGFAFHEINQKKR